MQGTYYPLALFGLGNPGLAYRKTRHNVGFLFLDYLVRKKKIPVIARKKKYKAKIRNVHLFNRDVHLIKPQTYMNRSGIAFNLILTAWHLTPQQTLVIYDDLDLPFGTFRIRKKGSSGGHRGMASIIQQAGTEDIPRIRIGIGGTTEYDNAAEYVLQPFTKEDFKVLTDLFSIVYEALESIFQYGIETAMSNYNNIGGL